MPIVNEAYTSTGNDYGWITQRNVLTATGLCTVEHIDDYYDKYKIYIADTGFYVYQDKWFGTGGMYYRVSLNYPNGSMERSDLGTGGNCIALYSNDVLCFVPSSNYPSTIVVFTRCSNGKWYYGTTSFYYGYQLYKRGVYAGMGISPNQYIYGFNPVLTELDGTMIGTAPKIVYCGSIPSLVTGQIYTDGTHNYMYVGSALVTDG